MKLDEIFKNMDSLFGTMDRMFGEMEMERYSIVDVGDNRVIEIDLPGVDPSTVEITYENVELKVSGVRKFSDGSTKRVKSTHIVPLAGVTADNITAKLQNGVLTVVLPKFTKKSSGNKVKVDIIG